MTKMASDKEVPETPNPESLTTTESSEVESELIIENLSNNMAVEEAKNIGALDQIMSKNFIEPKQSNFDQSSIIITKNAFEINGLLKHDISSNTNVITATDRGDIELTPNNDAVPDIDTSMKQNEIQNNNFNKENVNISNQENSLSIENELENNSESFNSNISNSEQDIIEKKALADLINEIESDEILTTEKSASPDNSSEVSENSLNMTEQMAKLTEKASKPKNMQGNDDLLTNNNNNDYEDALDAKDSCNEHDEQQKSKSEDSALNTEDSAKTPIEPAVDIKCEVDCDALLDNNKDEINYDEDYNVPENFMELANHFLTTEAIVVLQRIVVYKCPECPRVFTSSAQRALHKAKHIAEQVQSQKRNFESSDERFIKRHQCPECDMRFVQESTLATHMDVHQPYPYICDCGIGYTKLTDLEQHEKLVHNRIKTKPTYTSTWIPIINLKKTKRSEINRTRLKRQPEVPEPSPEPTISRYGRTQKRLVNIRENSPTLEYSSDDLDDDTAFQPKKKKAKVKFQSTEQIKAEEERPIKNENKKVQNKKKRKPIKRENNGPFICGICNKELSSYYTYELHLLVHSNLRNYKCEICNKRYNTAVVLKNHQQTHLENQFKCSFCDKTFNAKHNWKSHENIHMGLKLHVCGYCEKSFCDPSAYIRHVRTHTGVKPYKCEYCPKAFSDASGALVHRRRHKDERNFACRICGQAFYDAGARNNHEFTHNGDYKYECDVCSAKFQLKQYLVFHLRVHVPRKMVKCKLCKKELFNVNMDRHKQAVHGIGVKKGKRLKKPERIDIKAPLEIEIDTTKEF